MKFIRLFLSFALLTSNQLFAMGMSPYLMEYVKTKEQKAADATEELVLIFNNLGKTAAPNIKKLQELITKGANVNATNDQGKSLLQLAAAKNYEEGINILLAHGANPNQKVVDRSGYQNPLLIYAILSGSLSNAKSLLKAGADPNAEDNIGRPALNITVEKGYLPFAQLLLENNASPNIKDRLGNTPLFNAVIPVKFEQPTQDFIQLLQEYGADINALNNNQQTPLAYLLRYNTEYVYPVKLLLNAGADPNAPTSPLLETLFRARGDTREQIVRILLQAGADPNLRAEHGMNSNLGTPLEFAQWKLQNSPEQERESWQRIIGWLENPAKAPRIDLKEKLTLKPTTQKKLEEYLINQETESLKASEEFKKSAQKAAEKYIEQLKKEKQ